MYVFTQLCTETNIGQATTSSSIGGTVNAAHQQGGQTTSMDGSTAVEGIEEEKEERGVSARSLPFAMDSTIVLEEAAEEGNLYNHGHSSRS